MAEGASPSMLRNLGAADVAVQARSRGARIAVDGATAAAIAAIVGGTAAAQGGYFATSWGWTSLALAWLLGIGFVLAGAAPMSRLAGAYLLGFAALVTWVAGSTAWSVAPWESVLEVERTIVYVLGAAVVLQLGRRCPGTVYGMLLLAITLVAAYGLGTRLFPDRLGVFDPVAQYRLDEPIGYWNGLAVFAAMGSVLAVATATHAARLTTRAAAAAPLPLLLVTQYFTFSRGGWIALGIGLAGAIAFDARRLRLISVALALAVPATLAVLAASREPALTHAGATLAAATHEGHRLAVAVVALAAASAGVAAACTLVARAVDPSRRVRRAYAAVLASAAIAALVAGLVATGGPVSFAKHGWNTFSSAPPPDVQKGLDERLFSLSGNGRAQLWKVAWKEFRTHPWLGSGAGTFDRSWQATPKTGFDVQDAHGLYIETLGELGPVGLALLIATLALPLVAAVYARRSPLVPGAIGAYVAYLAHAAIDWDWELSGVTLTAVCCGSLVLLARPAARELRPRARLVGALGVAALVPVTAFAFVAIFGNSALGKSNQALENHDWSRAAVLAKRADKWMPWSPRPLILLGDAELGAGDSRDARVTFRRAIERDRGDWQGWYGLAAASAGRARASALREAKRLNTRAPGI